MLNLIHEFELRISFDLRSSNLARKHLRKNHESRSIAKFEARHRYRHGQFVSHKSSQAPPLSGLDIKGIMADELNLTPKTAETTVFEGEGGAYYLWAGANNPILRDTKLGAAKLLLHPHGFVIPHYADSAMIGYVLQGTCTVGMVSPSSPKEQVLVIKKGDAIPVPIGVVSWWFNHGDQDLVIIFSGETTKVYTPGQFTHFFVAGARGILGALSTNFLTKAYGLTDEESEKLAKNQTGAFIIKLGEKITFPKPNNNILNFRGKLYASLDKVFPWPAVDVKGGGAVNALTEANFPLLAKLGLCATIIKLEANAVFGPFFGTDESAWISYIISGSGTVEIIGTVGKAVSESELKPGEMFVTPRLLATAITAGSEGLEIFNVITSSKPVAGRLGGKTSVWEALSPVVLQAALNIDAEFAASLKAKVVERDIIVAPKKE